MRISCARSVCQDVCIRILKDNLRKVSVCGSLSKISFLGSLRQDPVVGPTCARTLYTDLLRKISESRSLHQGPVGPLVQDLCMRISCARCLRSPEQNPVGALVQDRCMRISCARCLCQDLFSRTTCARSLISVSGSLLVQDLSFRISASGSLQDHV